MEKLNRSVLITGMKHCGKSSTARLLSRHFSTPYTDIDDKAEEIYFNESGERLSSREIFKKKGRETFRNYELKASELIGISAVTARIIAAAGGGICDNSPAIKILKDSFIFIYIDEAAGVLYERIIQRGIPAFLSVDKPFEDFLNLYNKRSTIYNKLSNIHIRAEGRSTTALRDDIINRLREEGYAW